ncbi:MAG: hypothetical protein AVDCRST_MAG03-1076, partial [uncultured Rubrobacteraceae bacterium]
DARGGPTALRAPRSRNRGGWPGPDGGPHPLPRRSEGRERRV